MRKIRLSSLAEDGKPTASSPIQDWLCRGRHLQGYPMPRLQPRARQAPEGDTGRLPWAGLRAAGLVTWAAGLVTWKVSLPGSMQISFTKIVEHSIDSGARVIIGLNSVYV
jgi:hypothetical protein